MADYDSDHTYGGDATRAILRGEMAIGGRKPTATPEPPDGGAARTTEIPTDDSIRAHYPCLNPGVAGCPCLDCANCKCRDAAFKRKAALMRHLAALPLPSPGAEPEPMGYCDAALHDGRPHAPNADCEGFRKAIELPIQPASPSVGPPPRCWNRRKLDDGGEDICRGVHAYGEPCDWRPLPASPGAEPIATSTDLGGTTENGQKQEPEPSREASLPPLIILSQRMAEHVFAPVGTMVAISITAPGTARAALSTDYLVVLRAEFDDVDVDCPPMSATPMHGALARQIAQFVRSNVEQGLDGIMVHCYYGAGRSAGVALGIADGMGYPAATVAAMEDEFPIHNRGVRRLVRDAFTQTATWGRA